MKTVRNIFTNKAMFIYKCNETQKHFMDILS